MTEGYVAIVCHWCQPAWCLYLMTTTVMCSLLDVVEPRWWRWSLFDVVEPSWWTWRFLWWRWLLDEFWPCWGWHDSLMEMTWWCLALIRWWRWHTLLWWHDDMYVDGDDISCLDMLMEMTYLHTWYPWLLMRFPYPFLNPSTLANPCKPSHTLPCSLLYPITLPTT